MSVKELREECATIQLKPKGNRKKLVKRLMYAHTERKKQVNFTKTLTILKKFLQADNMQKKMGRRKNLFFG